jgi:phosphatidylserine/phosphatidylglycerophosphate/cardiolipin synthase-like enzyme
MQSENIHFHAAGWAEEMRTACDSAKISILISAMSMIPPRTGVSNAWRSLFDSWIAARKRGVAVAIYLAAPQQLPTATRGNNDAGAAAVRGDLSIHFVRGSRLLHAKSLVLDEKQVWIGSGNYTLAATSSNVEMWVNFESRVIADRIKKTLEALK